MAKWNMFSEEVAKERETVRAYGLDKVANRKPEGDSYKAQALRQLAMRLELELKVKELQSQIIELQNREETLLLQIDPDLK